MRLNHVWKLCMMTALLAMGTRSGLGLAIAAQGAQGDVQEGEQVLTRGPVHEAFAETVAFDPQPGIVVPKAPPNPIEEIPPDQKPEGANIEWIPGYWGWDDDRNDFIWISGAWRSVPPGRQWVPGYWAKSGEGYQWTSGYWADSKVTGVEYLPEPPATVEVGPNINAPSPDYGWIPGSWVWYQGRYAWRPGFWAKMQPDWVWIPAHYVWTPRGYIFTDGYWDYTIDRRGVLFAPVYFDSWVYAQPGFFFSPGIVIGLGVFSDSLFVRPSYGHYYFGDYYGAIYYGWGIYPWFSLHARRYGYDAIYAHQRWEHRADREWEDRLRREFRQRRDHEEARPTRSFVPRGQPGAGGGGPGYGRRDVAEPLDQLAKSKDSPWRFHSLDMAQRKEIGQRGQEVRKFRENRQELEAKMPEGQTGRLTQGSKPARERLPGSPIVGKSPEQFERHEAPPERYEGPKPDVNVEPAPRQGGERSMRPFREEGSRGERRR